MPVKLSSVNFIYGLQSLTLTTNGILGETNARIIPESGIILG